MATLSNFLTSSGVTPVFNEFWKVDAYLTLTKGIIFAVNYIAVYRLIVNGSDPNHVVDNGTFRHFFNTFQVLKSENPGNTHRGYYWVYQDPQERLVLFDYRQGRGREGPTEILKNFKGHLLRRSPLDKPMVTECMISLDSVKTLPCFTAGRTPGVSLPMRSTATG